MSGAVHCAWNGIVEEVDKNDLHMTACVTTEAARAMARRQPFPGRCCICFAKSKKIYAFSLKKKKILKSESDVS